MCAGMMKLAIGQQMLRYQGIRVIPTPQTFRTTEPPKYSMIHISLLPTFGRGSGFGAVSFNSKETGGQPRGMGPQARAVPGPFGDSGGGADSSSAIRIRSEPAKLPASAVRSRSRPR